MDKKVTKMQAVLVVKDLVSKKGNPFRTLSVNVKDKEIQLGFLPAELELALYKAGVFKD